MPRWLSCEHLNRHSPDDTLARPKGVAKADKTEMLPLGHGDACRIRGGGPAPRGAPNLRPQDARLPWLVKTHYVLERVS